MREKLYYYKCMIDRVVDGDTVDLKISLGFNVWIKERVRFYGINAPETRTRDKVEKAAGLKAKAFVIGWFKRSEEIVVRTHKDKRGKFGRMLGEFFIPGREESLNQEMVRLGLAKPYFGGKR